MFLTQFRVERTVLFLFLFFSFQVWSQPEPCELPPEMTPLCQDACIICDIDGYTGINSAGAQGEVPPGFCTSIVHNARWIAFIAGTEDLTIQLSVDNCDDRRYGLELALYESLDCETFQIVSNCDGNVGDGTSQVFTNTTPLTIGQYYYIVMDGDHGAICNWTFEVLQGSTEVSPLTSSGVITGPLNTCPGVLESYSTTVQTGATEYEWTVNGLVQGTGTELDFDFPNDGIYRLCVTASNACDVAPQSCRTIQVESIPPTILDRTICEGESFDLNDTISLNSTGLFEYHFLGVEGCDSVVFVDLTVFQNSITDYSVFICDGDSIHIGDESFDQNGQFTTTLSNANGCDSIVNLDLSLIICEMSGTAMQTPVKCKGESNGQISFSVIDGTPPFDYDYQRVDGTNTGSGTLANINQQEIISGLATGTYTIVVRDQFGNDVVLIETVEEPEFLSAQLNAADYDGYGISCFEGADGEIVVLPNGGTGPYSFLWNDGSSENPATNLSSGDYSVSITDANNCQTNVMITLDQPSELQFDAIHVNPNCDGPNTGQLIIQNISGGIAPYQINTGNGFSDELNYSQLYEDDYTIYVRDENGCEKDTLISLAAPGIPTFSLGGDRVVELGDIIALNLGNGNHLDSIYWSPDQLLSCNNCLRTSTQPNQSIQYHVTVTSADGCIREDSISIEVLIRERIFAPSAFSPNDDGINDFFTIFAGPEVETVQELSIFSRWGEYVFKRTNFSPNEEKQGWDGRFNGKLLQNDVYVWLAKVQLINGDLVESKGDITLIR